jgi:hypothetical protein
MPPTSCTMAQGDVYALGASLIKVLGCDGVLGTAWYNAQARLSLDAMNFLSCMIAPMGCHRWTAAQLAEHPYVRRVG